MKNVQFNKYRFFRSSILSILLSGLLFMNVASGQIAVVNSQTSTSSTTTITINKPSNLQAGDLMIANITQRNSATDATLIGWTTRTSYLLETNGRWATILYKVADANDIAAANFTFTLPTGTTAVAGGITAFRGVNTTTNGGIEVTGTAAVGNSTGPITPTQITTLSNNAMVLFFGQISGTGITFTSGNWTVGSNIMTQAYTVYHPSAEPGAGLAYLTQATAGPTGSGSKAISASARWGGVLLSLKPSTVPVISGSLTSSSTYGTTSSYTITASNSPTSFNAIGLPAGMSVNTSTGVITVGATTAAGTYNITISAANAAGTDSKTLSYTVNKAPLTITGISISNKIFDGNTTATITGTAAYSGLQNGETFPVTGTPTASFADPNVGNGKPVTVTGYTAPSPNYSIIQPTGLTADITAASLPITAVNDTVRINTTCFVNNNVIEANVLANDTDPDNNLDRSSVLLINPANPAQTGTTYTVAGIGQWLTNGTTVSFIAAGGFIGIAEIGYRVCDSTGNCSSARVVLELGDRDSRGCFPGSVWDVVSSDTVFATLPASSGSGVRNPSFILGTPDYDAADTMTYAFLSAVNNNVVLDFGTANPVTTANYDSIRIYWASASASNSVIRIEHSLNNTSYSGTVNDTTNNTDPATEFSFRVPDGGLRYIRITYVSGAIPRIDGAQAEKWSCIEDSTDAENDNIVVREDIPSQINLLENDNIAGDYLSELTITSQPRRGRISINIDNTVTYLNNTDFPTGNGPGSDGLDTFSYRICNSYGSCATATAFVRIINDRCNSLEYRPLGASTINVTIPGVNSNMIDSYIKKDKKDENKGTSTTLEIGKSKSERRGVFKFNVKLVRDSIGNRMPGGTIWSDAIINSAKFYLYKKGGDGVNLNLSAHSISIPTLPTWTEGTGSNNSGVTWRRKDGVVNWTTEGVDYVSTPVSAITASSANAFKIFELKSLVQSWMLVSTDTFGILIRQNATKLVDKRHQYQSSDVSSATSTTPKLEINFSAPLPCAAIPNRPPMANPDYASIGTEDSVIITPLINDSDPDNNNIVLATVSRLSTVKGTVSTSGTSIIYKPNFSVAVPRTDTLLYRINDGPLFDSAYIFIKISFRANAGNDRNICSSKDTLRLSGKITGNLTSCQWTTNGSGQFSNATITNPVYTLSSADRNLSSLRFILNTTSPGSGCGAILDTINFTIGKQPLVSAGGPDSVCSATTPSAISLTGSSLTNASNGTWSIISGTGSLSSTAAQANPATVSFTPGSDFSGNVQLKLKSNSTAACPADSANRNLYIKPNMQILTNPVSKSICQGNSDTLKVTTNVASSSFQWFSSSNGTTWTSMSDGGGYSGTSSASLVCNALPLTSSTLQFKVRISNPAACLSPKESTPVSLKFKNLWMGNTSSSWDDPLNWSDQTLPGIGCPDVYIMGNRPNQPVISNTTSLNNIRVMDNGVLSVIGRLRISGSISTEGSGKINANNGTIDLFGNSAAQTISGSNFLQRKIRNLVVSNPAGVNISNTAGDTINISGKLSFGNVNNSVLNTGNNLTLVSDSNGTAAVADITNNGTNSGNSITGNVTVERYIRQARKWQFLSIPTNTTQSFKESWMEGANSITENPRPGYGTVITDNRSNWQTLGFDAQSPGGPSVKIYNPVAGNFDAISSTSTGISTNFGYMAFIRGDRLSQPLNSNRNPTVLRTKGPLKQGTQASIPVADSSFVSIGNPFASAIDMRKISKPNCPNAFYIWDPNLAGSYGVGGYQTFNLGGFDTATGLASYIAIPGGGSYGSNLEPFNQIQSGQAFFIRGGIGGSIQMEENDKLPDSTRQVMRPGRYSLPVIRPGLYSIVNNSPVLEDGCGIFFNDNFSNEIGLEDAVKLSNTGVNVAIRRNGQSFAVEGRKSLGENDTFFINISGLRRAAYEWDVNMLNMQSPGRIAFLIDNFSGARTRLNLDGANAYRFSVTQEPASSDPGRFMIVFRQPAYIPLEFTHFSGNRIEKRIDLSWSVIHENGNWKYEIERSGEDGIFKSLAENRQEASGNGVSRYSFSDNDPLMGNNHYRIKAKDAFGHTVYSEKILVEENSLDEFVSIRPNPVTGKKIRLFFSRPQSGKCRIELTNNSGINLLSGEYVLLPGSRELQLPRRENLTSGIYFIKVTGIRDNNTSTLKLIIP